MDYLLTQCIKEIEEKLSLQSQITLAWKKFVSQEEYEIEIDRQVYEDWVRIHRLGVNHQMIPRKLVSDQELEMRLKRMQPVLELAIPLMEGMFEALSPSHSLHNLKIYDQDAVLLHLIADEQTLKLMSQLGLKKGSLMSEQYWGNNGAGTSLLKKKPICIVGQEHYLEIFKPWVCFDYPVHDTDGSLIAGINISVALETANPLTMALLESGVRNLEEQLREREFRQSVTKSIKAKDHFYRQIINRVKQGIVVYNHCDEVVMANQFAMKHFHNLNDWEKEKCYITELPGLADYLKRENYIDNTKVEIDGQICLISVSELDNEPEGAGCKILVTNDVTELDQYEKQNHHKDKLALVGTIAAGLAHELRNPLTAIKGFIQMALARDSIDDKTRQQLSISLEEIERTNKLISDFLLLGKPRPEKKKKLSLTEVIVSSVQLCEHHAHRNGTEIVRNFVKDDYYVYGDRDKLIQVFLNIISNGVDAMKDTDNKVLKISMNNQEGFIRVMIEDSGIGIKEEILEQLGTPFFTTKENGVGLGLSIANNIINAHNGRIDVKSTGGVGSVFSIFLPVFQEAVS